MHRGFTLLVAIVAIASPGIVRAQQAQTIKWRTGYNEARKEARDKNLPLIVDFVMQGCIPCKKLEDTTFRDAKVVELLSDRFVALKIEQEKDTDLVTKLRITGFPTIMIAGPDGHILQTLEGYQEAPRLVEVLQRIVAGTSTPDWMGRDYQLAAKLIAGNEYARAIAVLKNIVDDGAGRPVQKNAHKLLGELEQKAAERVSRAKQLSEKNQSVDAIQLLSETIRDFPGLSASREAADLMTKIAQNPEIRNQQRARRAQELLTQAKEHYKQKEYFLSLDRCELLMSSYGDLSEGQEANQLASEIKNNPELLITAVDNLSDRLGNMYLALADSLLKKGQRAQAVSYLQRVVSVFPGTRQAESAQIRLAQLQGVSTMRVDFTPPTKPER